MLNHSIDIDKNQKYAISSPSLKYDILPGIDSRIDTGIVSCFL